MQREHVAVTEPAGGEPGGDPLDAAGELAVGEHPPARAVDDRRLAGEAAGVAEHERRQVGARDLGIGPGTADHRDEVAARRSVDMVDLLKMQFEPYGSNG